MHRAFSCTKTDEFVLEFGEGIAGSGGILSVTHRIVRVVAEASGCAAILRHKPEELERCMRELLEYSAAVGLLR
jgi:hypothetical protein